MRTSYHIAAVMSLMYAAENRRLGDLQTAMDWVAIARNFNKMKDWWRS